MDAKAYFDCLHYLKFQWLFLRLCIFIKRSLFNLKNLGKYFEIELININVLTLFQSVNFCSYISHILQRLVNNLTRYINSIFKNITTKDLAVISALLQLKYENLKYNYWDKVFTSVSLKQTIRRNQWQNKVIIDFFFCRINT